MEPMPSFLDELEREADRAAAAESDFRRGIAERIKALESERAFAFRRLNLMRAVAEGVAGAESEDMAVAVASAVLGAKLGWSSESEARSAVLSCFAPVARAIFASLAPAETEAPEPQVLDALAEFETWYAKTHPGPFWTLFEHYMPETPVVDF